jgi:hypothetical protein
LFRETPALLEACRPNKGSVKRISFCDGRGAVEVLECRTSDSGVRHEPSALFRNLLQDVGFGFEARTTWSGYEALSVLEARGVDVLVVDDYVGDLHVGDFLKRVGHLAIQPWIIVMQATEKCNSDQSAHWSLLSVFLA